MHLVYKVISAAGMIRTCVGTNPTGPKPVPFGHSGTAAKSMLVTRETGYSNT